MTPFELASCTAGDDILFLGHPKNITEKVYTRNGPISGDTARKFLYKQVLTATKGTIKSALCDEKHGYQLRLSGIMWHQMSGGPIVLASDPSQVCGTISRTEHKAPYPFAAEFTTDHVGICSNHPDIRDIAHS